MNHFLEFTLYLYDMCFEYFFSSRGMVQEEIKDFQQVFFLSIFGKCLAEKNGSHQPQLISILYSFNNLSSNGNKCYGTGYSLLQGMLYVSSINFMSSLLPREVLRVHVISVIQKKVLKVHAFSAIQKCLELSLVPGLSFYFLLLLQSLVIAFSLTGN